MSPREGSPATSGEILNGLAKSESQLRAFIDQLPALAWSARPDGSPEFLNEQCHAYTGLSSETLCGSGWEAAVHADDMERMRVWWATLLERGAPGETEIRFRRFDGAYRWFLVRALPAFDERRRLVAWYGNNTDIEDFKRAEEKLKQRETELQQIVDTIAELIIFLRPDGSAIHANRFALDYTGIPPEDVDKTGFRERIFHPDDVERLREERRKALLGSVPFGNEQRVLGKDGRYRWFSIRYNALLDQHGAPIRWYAAGIDIDERKKIEERLRNENVALRDEVDRTSMFEEIVGSSEPMRRVLKQVDNVAPSDSTVLILGETGTGKELLARALHRRSRRSAQAFVRVNCAAIPPALIASELFGHEKGAFTGALERRLGRFEAADGGTLFLDEIGDLPMETQIALLRVLQEREFERVGSNRPVSVDVRLIAATNRDLSAAVAAGTFRQDLFYRLNVFPITVPELRKRVEDIPVLLEYFVGRYARKVGKRIRHIGKHTIAACKAYSWPGNIRELQNVVERSVILTDGDTFFFHGSWLKPESTVSSRSKQGLSVLTAGEVELIEAALAECHGRISGPSGAAVKLGIPRQTLESKIKSLGINKYGSKAQV
ncbi:MAG: sigma-54-dependent Fis family transcriptional regulator [Bryobacteraceae bacterium]|nr:sigma-54-dependent Fis family transcriptional regulator [Bryobacteraceae bacterium]